MGKAILGGGLILGGTILIGSLLIKKVKMPAAHSVLEGKVSDLDTGEPIAGASISLNEHKTVSKSDGSYSLTLPFGTYTLTVEVTNYRTHTAAVTLEEQRVYTLDFTLERVGPPVRIPVAIVFPTSPQRITQFYRSWVSTRDVRQHLRIYPCIDEQCTSEELLYVNLLAQVLDAAGVGVPDIPVLVWHSAVPDAEGGSLNLFGTVRTSENPLRLVSDANGFLDIFVGYRLPEDIIRGHCHFWPTGEVVKKTCVWYWVLPFSYMYCDVWKTILQPYSVFAQIEGTTRMGIGLITGNAKST